MTEQEAKWYIESKRPYLQKKVKYGKEMYKVGHIYSEQIGATLEYTIYVELYFGKNDSNRMIEDDYERFFSRAIIVETTPYNGKHKK